MNKFSIKILVARITFVFAILGCWFLYRNNLADYLILSIVLILFLGIFTFSGVSTNSSEIFIKKNYFWGIFWFRKKLKHDQVTSVSSKEYLVIQNDSLDWGSLMPETKTKWVMTRIAYEENGNKKSIEVKISAYDIISLKNLKPDNQI